MLVKNEKAVRIARFHERSPFEKNLRDEIIKAMEDGVPRNVIAFQYGISRGRLCDWMSKHSSAEYQAKLQGKHLSEIEKRSIIRSIEQGSLTPHVARKTYGLAQSTLKKWLRNSLKENDELASYKPSLMENNRPTNPDSEDPEREALIKALQEAQMKIRALDTLIDVAEDQFKIAIRKKAGARQSS
jgi:transposase-like protein